MQLCSYVSLGGWWNDTKNQANIHKVQDCLRSWKNKPKRKLKYCFRIWANGPHSDGNGGAQYLSGENREKLLSVGTTPAKLLNDTFLFTYENDTVRKNRLLCILVSFVIMNLQDIEAEAVHQWRDISSDIVVFQFSTWVNNKRMNQKLSFWN